MRLLPKDRLIRTSRIDHADWTYRPLLSWIVRRRYAMLMSMLPARVPSILEVGFGSGIFMPELAAHCDTLYGVDVHARVPEVQARLFEYGVAAQLFCEGAAHTSFADSSIDVIVALSALEFIEDMPDAAQEFARILKPGGRLLAVMPGKSRLLDLELREVTGECAERDYGDRRSAVVPELMTYFRIARTKRYLWIYTLYDFERRER